MAPMLAAAAIAAAIAASVAAADPSVGVGFFLTDAAKSGAVCLDGTPGAYYLSPGTGSGSDSWYIHQQGGGWVRQPPPGTPCIRRCAREFSRFPQHSVPNGSPPPSVPLAHGLPRPQQRRSGNINQVPEGPARQGDGWPVGRDVQARLLSCSLFKTSCSSSPFCVTLEC
eukprot:SAG31_NODE_3312_length_4432_cov_2.870298_1_plen_169_part_00